ncbi:MAG: hypothetical protein ACXACU_18280 [Candidatus Hodarchaeales archaeon]|jgi:hypothetical protein
MPKKLDTKRGQIDSKRIINALEYERQNEKNQKKIYFLWKPCG